MIFSGYIKSHNSGWLFAAIMLLFSALSLSARDFILVIDPGHGGRDLGAAGKSGYEKDINLNVARMVGERIDSLYDDVKIVYTRSTDKFVSLADRASIANKVGGDLFISIHVNSVDRRNRNRNTIAGASVYTLGLHRSNDNLEVAKRENAVMALEKDFSETYEGFDPESAESYIIFELSQNIHMAQSVKFASDIQQNLISHAGRNDRGVRQAGFWVLWATGMPSVLVELDFICNPDVEKFLLSDSGQSQMADAIAKAFSDYKTRFDNESSAIKSSRND